MRKNYRIKISVEEDLTEKTATVAIKWTKGISEAGLTAALTCLKEMAGKWYREKHGERVPVPPRE